MKKREPDIEEMMAADTGKGVSSRIVDSGFWKKDEPNPRIWIEDEDNPWIFALLAIDKLGNKQLLVELLQSQTPLSNKDQQHIAHLLERFELTRPHINLDNRGDKQFFIDMLRSKSPLSHNDRQLLANALGQLKKGPGRPEKPSYFERTDAAGELMRAKELVAELRNQSKAQGRRLTIKQAVKEVAPQFPHLNRDTLKSHCEGRHSSARRSEKQNSRPK